MIGQMTLSFESRSVINKERLTRQNRIIFDYLEKGNTINTVKARELFQVYNLHSRISEIRNEEGVILYDRMIRVGRMNVKEYSLKPFAMT